MKSTEIIVRHDKRANEPLIVLLDAEANIGYLPYVEINGPLDEMRLEYYHKNTSPASSEEIEDAVKYIKERYEVEEVKVRKKLPTDFREKIWGKRSAE